VGAETPVSDLMSDSSFGCAPAAKKRRSVQGKVSHGVASWQKFRLHNSKEAE
jgi:hypothetical protein